jgi:hypothetical protein
MRRMIVEVVVETRAMIVVETRTMNSVEEG